MPIERYPARSERPAFALPMVGFRLRKQHSVVFSAQDDSGGNLRDSASVSNSTIRKVFLPTSFSPTSFEKEVGKKTLIYGLPLNLTFR